MTEPILKLSDIGKAYGPVDAAKDINLDVAPGEFVTFLGPSGSGKTTTLMMVAGFTEPTEGHIHLQGKPLDPIPVWKRDIGMVFQHYALFPHMSVAQNVAFPLEMRGVPKADRRRRVDEALEMVGLAGMGLRLPKELSGGQQQRVALARAMVFKPSLLLMDEPLGALDKKLREHMQIEIMHLHKNLGATVLYVTHDQEEALVMSDRIAVFNDGRIEQIGSPRDLYEAPDTKFVADFIGQTNFIAGSVEQITGKTGAVRGLRGQLSRDLPEGSGAVLAVRPERLHVVGDATVAGDDNMLSGTVKELIYLGQSRKAVIALEDGTEIIALEQAAQAEATALEIGAQATLSFRSQDARILADV
ncbi:ABC transporter ATP-binding protein [Roseovarius rhodophyticola]|uniref:Spermidine/putrescine import ATP-binding protein PotA n=1 Tax=Roseovarius rhodophyticola TaxID=3080827 RepID=A0ABZ2TGE3_9RHOB|nr:ABC transporter ATP-binding protein [Roseovarius sp. W115]MDV2930521.1 ABC transporter ATP-binding protein [Roseovarius sp. W115]